MKCILAALIITIALSAVAYSQTKTKQERSNNHDEQMFKRLEREMFDATEGKPNLEAVERIWADDFFSINHDGSAVNKQQMMVVLRSGQVLADRITSDEFRLRRYGNTVVVTGRSAYFTGGRKVGEVRHTQIWVKRSGRWQLVGWQGTPLGEVTINKP
jgi:hypothetical protein